MEKRPESFENMADVFKISLGQMESRFSELEGAVFALNDKLKEVRPDMFSSTQQRVDDLEDLTMVEQAGVIEIKKMLEGMDQKFEEISASASKEDVERELKELREKVAAVSESASNIIGVQEKLGSLETDVRHLSEMPAQADITGLQKALDDLNAGLKSAKDYSESAVKNLNSRIDNISQMTPQAGVDFDFLKSKSESLQSAIDIASDKNMENDMKISDLMGKVEMVNQKMKDSQSQRMIDEVKDGRRNITLIGARLDATEKVVKSLTENLMEVEKTSKKFEGFETLTNLNREVEDKLEKFKLMEGEIQRLTNHVDMIYGSINSKLAKVEMGGKQLENINKNMEDVKANADRLKVEMMSFVSKAELEKRISERVEKVGLNRNFVSESMGKLENRVGSLEDSQTEDFRKLDTIGKRLDYLAGAAMCKDDIEKKISESLKGFVPNNQNVFKSINDIRSKLGVLESAVKSVPKQAEVQIPKELEAAGRMLPELEKRISEMESRLVHLMDPAAIMEAQVMGVVDRFIFLESRLAAIEAGMQKMNNVQPIILE